MFPACCFRQRTHSRKKGTKTLIKTSPTRQDSFILKTGENSSLIEFPIKKSMCHTRSLTKNFRTQLFFIYIQFVKFLFH